MDKTQPAGRGDTPAPGRPGAAALLALSLAAAAATAGAREPDTGVTRYEVDAEDFAQALENLEFAVTGQGLVINNTMHIGEMLARTGEDLGHEPVFGQAESVAFCSAQLTYRMLRADPRNITVCPYTISVYTTAAEPDRIYLAYRSPALLGEGAEAVEADIAELLDTIAREAAGQW